LIKKCFFNFKIVDFIHSHRAYYLSTFEHAKDLAPTLVQYGGREGLGSESQMIFDFLKTNGAPVTLLKNDLLGHCYLFFLDTPEGSKLLDSLIEWFVLRWSQN